jgi:meso-butanediol dehydrogenase/(S,S)-butanediol dehydrogenase/diacetyl reductase
MKLEDKVALVTGAANGLGAGIVEALLAQGARVALADINAPALQATQARLDPLGDRTIGLVADVTDEAAIEHLVAGAVAAFGRVDALVNNAGVIAMGEALQEGSDRFDFQFAVNVGGLFACCKATARRFIAQQSGGAIVNIASNAGKVGFPAMAGYNASKAAVINLTRTLAAEWASHRINVNAVCPGSVATPMLRNVAEFLSSQTGQPADQHFGRMVPAQLKRHIQPVEVGRVVAFLLSDEAEIIRGQSINVDGGETPY